MSKEKITVDNCRKHAMDVELHGYATPEMQAKCWETVYLFCNQNGMEPKECGCGIESVISFIDGLLKNQNIPVQSLITYTTTIA